jgi:hypothetical protein
MHLDLNSCLETGVTYMTKMALYLVTFRVKKNMSDIVVKVLKKTHKWPSIMMIATNVWPMLKRPPMSLHHLISSLP